jgi:hypothetical protein
MFFIIPSGEWEKNPRLQAKTSVCPDGAKKRNIIQKRNPMHSKKIIIYLVLLLLTVAADQIRVKAEIPVITGERGVTPKHKNSCTFLREEELPAIFVSIVTHNEEPPQYPDFVNDETAFWIHRNAVVEFADMLYREGVSYNYQSEWNFLRAAILYDNGTPSTKGKNFLRYLREDLDVEIDPHAHETQYNYADVACLIDLLDVPVSRTVGGFIALPPENSKLEYLWGELTGWNYPAFRWKADILWGGATKFHQNEEELWISGIWKPKDNENFLVHEANAPLPHIGGYLSTWIGLDDLLQKQQNQELDPAKIYTCTLFVGQDALLHPHFVGEFQQTIQSYSEFTGSGLIEWKGLGEVIDIWIFEYDSKPNIYSYLYGDITD